MKFILFSLLTLCDGDIKCIKESKSCLEVFGPMDVKISEATQQQIFEHCYDYKIVTIETMRAVHSPYLKEVKK